MVLPLFKQPILKVNFTNISKLFIAQTKFAEAMKFEISGVILLAVIVSSFLKNFYV